MKTRLLLTALLLAASAGLSGCVVYPYPGPVAVEPAVVVGPGPGPYPYYGPRYRDYHYYGYHRGWDH